MNPPPPEAEVQAPAQKGYQQRMSKAYLTKERAAKISGRSVRRLLELASAGRIRKRIIRDPGNGNREQAVFDPDDIAALAKGKIPPPTAALQISSPGQPLAALQQRETASVIPPTNRLWLTVAEAAEYSGLPAGFLHGLLVGGKLPALDVGHRAGGRWRIARRDLDAITAQGGGGVQHHE